jgi:Flp pilus assembly protein TadG
MKRLYDRPLVAARRRLGAEDAGLASLELVILLPAFIILTLLAGYLGRMNVARTAVDGAAQDAARAASVQRDLTTAETSAKAAAKAALDASDSPCVYGTADATIRQPPDPFAVALGTASSVVVTVTCKVDVSNLAFPGLPIPSGQQTLTSTFVSPIDTHRVRTNS